MGMQYDVKSAYRTTDGTLLAGPARIKGILISPSTSAGSLVLKDGGVGGTTVFELNWPANAGPTPFNVVVPGEGIRCATNISAVASAGLTAQVFYG